MPCILLAEGHAPTRELVSRALRDVGLEVLAAADPEQAYELYASRRPDAVVIGAEGAEALAERLRAADPRVLLVVADAAHLGRARGLAPLLSLGANAYVADPTTRELADKVRQLVEQRAAARARLRGVPRVLSRAPAAEGEVQAGVVARLLHQIWRSLSEGVLVLAERGGELRVFFLRGVPVACQADDPARSIVRWLRDGGRLDAAAHQAALEAMASGLSPGAALIAAGVVEPGEPLEAMERAHLKATLVRAVGAKEGRWRFHSGAEFAREVHATEVPPLQVILEGARAGLPVKHLADALRAVADAYPVRTGDFQPILPAAALGASDLKLALALDGATRTRDWLGARRGELDAALSLLWFLSMLGAVAFHEAPEAPAAGGVAPAPSARPRKPLPADRADAVRQAALQILPGTYLHALGVDLAATPEEIERAYEEVARRFHPDGFAEWDVGDLEDLLAAVQDKLAAAHRVLSSEERRRAYLSFLLLRFEVTGARRPGIDLDAEIALRLGERALRARRNAEAVTALKAAAQRNPKEPEYAAMLGFAELFDPVLPPSERVQEARRNAKRALSLAPEHPRALAVLALAEQARGDAAEARRVTVAALKTHPQSELLKAVLHRLNRAKG